MGVYVKQCWPCDNFWSWWWMHGIYYSVYFCVYLRFLIISFLTEPYNNIMLVCYRNNPVRCTDTIWGWFSLSSTCQSKQTHSYITLLRVICPKYYAHIQEMYPFKIILLKQLFYYILLLFFFLRANSFSVMVKKIFKCVFSLRRISNLNHCGQFCNQNHSKVLELYFMPWFLTWGKESMNISFNGY